jgi:hypothetical protein
MGKDHIKRVNQLKEKRNSRNDSDEEAALTKYAKYPKPKQIFLKICSNLSSTESCKVDQHQQGKLL